MRLIAPFREVIVDQFGKMLLTKTQLAEGSEWDMPNSIEGPFDELNPACPSG